MGIVVQGHRPNSCNKGTQKDVLTIISNPATEQVMHRWSAIRYHQMMNSGQLAYTYTSVTATRFMSQYPALSTSQRKVMIHLARVKSHVAAHKLECNAAALHASLDEAPRYLLGELIHEPLCICVILKADGVVDFCSNGPGRVS